MLQRLFGRTPGGVRWLGLHLVSCPKYRYWIVDGLARRLGKLIKHIAGERGQPILAAKSSPITCTRRCRLGRPMRQGDGAAPRGRAAQLLPQKVPHLRQHAKVLRSPSYFTAWVGYVSGWRCGHYVKHRWDPVIAS